MKFTNIDAFESLKVLNRLRESGKLGYTIAKNRRKLNDELKEYIQQRDEIVVKYGKPLEDGSYTVPQEDAQEYLAEINDLDNIEFDVSMLTVDVEAFTCGELTSQDMYILDWMVQE